MKSWVLHRVAGRSDLPPRDSRHLHEPDLDVDAAPRHGDARRRRATRLRAGADLGVYAPLIGAVRDELEHFVASHVRLHVVIAERDRFLLTSIGVRSPGGAEARELLRQFMHEFRPEQVKRYLAREVIGRLPNAAVIDLSQFAGLADLENGERPGDDGEYRELLAALRTTPALPIARPYEVSVIGRWSEAEPASATSAAPARARRLDTPTTPLAGRRVEFDIDDGAGTRRAVLPAVVPGRRYVVGKDESADLRVDGTYTSRRHAEIWLDDDGWHVADAGSTNGLRVESGGADGTPARVVATAATGDATPIRVGDGHADRPLGARRRAAGRLPVDRRPAAARRGSGVGGSDADRGRRERAEDAADRRCSRVRHGLSRFAIHGDAGERRAQPCDRRRRASAHASAARATRRSSSTAATQACRASTSRSTRVDDDGAHGVVHGDNGIVIDGVAHGPGDALRLAARPDDGPRRRSAGRARVHARPGARRRALRWRRSSLITPIEPGRATRPGALSRGAAAPTQAVYATAACRLEAAVASSCGSQHAVNEDAHSALDGSGRLFVVADGVGGGAMAQTASRLLVAAAAPGARRAAARRRARRDARCSPPTGRSPRRSPASPSGRARRRSRCARRSTPSAARWLVAWVGDCRVYRWSARGAGQLDLLTRDDTFGHLGETPPPGGSPHDPARMVGNGATTGANVAVHGLGRDELLVLCSDGVHKHLDGADWCRVLGAPVSLAQRGQALVALARKRGSVDDATVLLLHRSDPEPRDPRWRGRAAVRFDTRKERAMTPADIDRVFGRGRLRMVTGDHVEVFREHVAAGRAAPLHQALPRHRRRRLQRVDRARVAHPRAPGRPRHQAGARRRPLRPRRAPTGRRWCRPTTPASPSTTGRRCCRSSATARPCATSSRTARTGGRSPSTAWSRSTRSTSCSWSTSTSRPTTSAFRSAPADFDPHARGQWLQPRFDDIALIDFAFSLVSGERLDSALPIAQQADYDYQSPRLLRALEAGRHGDLAPTRQLDWRCDLFSLAAMLWRYLPELEDTTTGAWTRPRHAKARALVRRLIEAHDAELPARAAARRADRARRRAARAGRAGRIAAARLDAGVRQPRRPGGIADAGDADRAAGDRRR